MRATHPVAEPTTRIGQALQRAWAPGQRRIDLLVHARRIAGQADAHYTLPPETYGRPNEHVTDRITRLIEDAHPGLTLIAVGFWGRGREDVQTESLDIRVGFLMQDRHGVPSIATAEMKMPRRTVAASRWETFANWVLDQHVSMVRDPANETWAWNSTQKFERPPVPTLGSVIYGTDREIELQTGLLEHAAQLVHDKALERHVRHSADGNGPDTDPRFPRDPSRPRPGR